MTGETTAARRKPPAPAVRVVAERGDPEAMSRRLWKGLIAYNRQYAGPTRYSRTVLTARDARDRVLGGVIVESYYLETYVELLWLSARARGAGIGAQLLDAAEARARRRGSRLIHLNTYSFQAPGFYEKRGYTRFGGMRGSPPGASRHFYVKHLAGAAD